MPRNFALDGDLIVIDAVVIGPSGRANIQLVLDTGAVLTTLVPTVAQAIVISEANLDAATGGQFEEAVERRRAATFGPP